MKRAYEKPAFAAEQYQLTNSIAACQYHIDDPDTQKALVIEKGKSYCGVGDGGHDYGKSPVYDLLQRNTTVFNDGTADTNGCECDWNGGKVTLNYEGKKYTYKTFGDAFYGAVAGNPNHEAAYEKKVFFS